MSLKQRLGGPTAVYAPGAYDAITALMVERAGFEAVYLSGASIAYATLGRPDIGLVGVQEVLDVVMRVRDRIALPIVVDADTGYGNALNVQRTVRLFERAGATAIQLEDQSSPKRCGHLADKGLVSAAEMVGKVRAAVDARASAETLIVARTDAIAVEGYEAALERAECYLEAGADVLFVEAPQIVDQLRSLAAQFADRVPLVANMVEGGRTPLLPVAELEAIGFRLVISPGALMRALVPVMEELLAAMKRDGGTQGWRDRMLDLMGLNARIGLEEILAIGRSYEG